MSQKDPAFLFYSKDFYEGTRMMLPEERACYIDLLIYQHQNGGFVPDDLKRLRLYCSGIDEATLQATLEAKFEKTEKGWRNIKLAEVVSDRTKFSEKQSINGKVGQFFKKAKALLPLKEYQNLRELLLKNRNNEDVLFIINQQEQGLEINKAMLQAMLKHLAIANAIVIEDVIVNEDEDLSKKVKILKGEKVKISLPFDSEIFSTQWQLWKAYRKKKDKFEYIDFDSEQRALSELANISKQDEKTALAIIHQSIDKGWKGFFELKNNQNGNNRNNQQATDADHKQSAIDAVNAMFGVQ